MPTPEPATTSAILTALDELKVSVPLFDRVSVGFPGVIKQGKTLTAANLDPGWIGFPLAKTLEKRWGKPVRMANDCAVGGYAVIQGNGVELVITLGTGMGSALFTEGVLCPGLELGHHPWRKKTYEEYLGRRGLEKYGVKRWNKLLKRAIEQTAATFNWDTLYIGGGNAKKVDSQARSRTSRSSPTRRVCSGPWLCGEIGNRGLRRLQLFEVLDQAWCPQAVRHGATDYLEAITSRADIYRAYSGGDFPRH